MNTEIYKKARMFESEEVSQMYVLAGFLNEWQKETGYTLEDFLRYLDEHCKKKDRVI